MSIYDMNILISVIALLLNLYVVIVLIYRWRCEKKEWKGGKHNGRHR